MVNCISTILQKGDEEHFSRGGFVRVFKNFAVEGLRGKLNMF